jgi:hypothetical protein
MNKVVCVQVMGVNPLLNPIVITDALLERVEECPIDISVLDDDSVDG